METFEQEFEICMKGRERSSLSTESAVIMGLD
jgi:hypothetical protein